MLDFSAYPPEVNSTRIYFGAGAGSMLAAATHWGVLAKELFAAAQGLQSALETLLVSFRGQSAAALTRRVSPKVEWLNMTAESAERIVIQLGAAAKAYEAALATTVPPLTVYANRVQTQVLKAFNWFGQFATMIADKEADYNLMWSQNAAAMFAYHSQVVDVIGATLPFEAAPEMVSEVGLVRDVGLIQEEDFESFWGEVGEPVLNAGINATSSKPVTSQLGSQVPVGIPGIVHGC